LWIGRFVDFRDRVVVCYRRRHVGSDRRH
jgi:hypothetical protein